MKLIGTNAKHLAFALSLVASGCSNSERNSHGEGVTADSPAAAEASTPPSSSVGHVAGSNPAYSASPTDAGRFTPGQICRATIAVAMGRDPKIIKITSSGGGIIKTKYVRDNDHSVWENRCKIEGNTVVWATATGRWRNDSADEIFKYSVAGDVLTISQMFSDGSSSDSKFASRELGD